MTESTPYRDNNPSKRSSGPERIPGKYVFGVVLFVIISLTALTLSLPRWLDSNQRAAVPERLGAPTLRETPVSTR